MSLVVNTNIASLNAQRNLSGTQHSMSRNLARLSSGLRIVSAADDAAGLAISEGLKAQIRSTSQAERNANDGVSLTQVAEGAMEQVGNILLRMRELAVQAANGTVDSNSITYLQNEFATLRSEIDRISAVTDFNNTALLDGSLTNGITLQIGVDNSANDRIVMTIGLMNSGTVGTSGGTMLTGVSIGAQTGAQTAITVIDNAVGMVADRRARLGALQNRLEVTLNNLSTSYENLSAANSRIRDVDVAVETASLTRNQILSQAGIAVLAQANQLPSAALSLLRG